jgi:hypothetical protein
MIRKWDYTDNIYYRPATVTPKPEPTLPADVRRKMETRRMYFLSEEHIVLLRGQELRDYVRKAWYWLVVNQHVGPFWLTAVLRTVYNEPVRLYWQGEPLEKASADELPADLRELSLRLTRLMQLPE